VSNETLTLLLSLKKGEEALLPAFSRPSIVIKAWLSVVPTFFWTLDFEFEER